MKAAIYCRVSTVDQHPENQKAELVQYAERMGWPHEVFEETESTRNTRPVQYGLYLRCLRREFDVLLVWKLDRWGRSLKELVTQVDELLAKGVQFISLKDNLDLSTAGGKLQFHIFSAFAEYERAIISERTRMALQQRKLAGQHLGRPFGAKDKKKRRIKGYLK